MAPEKSSKNPVRLTPSWRKPSVGGVCSDVPQTNGGLAQRTSPCALPAHIGDYESYSPYEGGIKTRAGVHSAPAAPAPAPTAVRRGGRGEGRLGIEKRGAGAIIRRQRVEVGDVSIHEGRHGLPRLVGMLQPEHMPQFVEHDPMQIDRIAQRASTELQGAGIGVPTELRI